MQVPLIISGQALAAAWNHWQESRSNPDSLTDRLVTGESSRAKQKIQIGPASFSQEASKDAANISVNPTGAQTQQGKASSHQGQSCREKEHCNEDAERQNGSPVAARTVAQQWLTQSARSTSKARFRPAVGREQLYQGCCSTSQALQESQARLDGLTCHHQSAKDRRMSCGNGTQTSARMADCVVAVCFSGGYASGVVIHSSGVVLTVAHAVRPEPEATPSHDSIHSSYLTAAQDLAQDRVTRDETASVMMSKDTDDTETRS